MKKSVLIILGVILSCTLFGQFEMKAMATWEEALTTGKHILYAIEDSAIDMAGDDIGNLKTLNDACNLFREEDEKTLITPTVDWLDGAVEECSDYVSDNRETHVDEVFSIAITDLIVSDQIDNLKDDLVDEMVKDPVSKKLENFLKKYTDVKDSKAFTGKIMGKLDTAEDVVSFITSMGEVKEILEGDDADKWLKAYLETGDAIADATGGNIIWEVNSALWNGFIETEEWKEFVEESGDNFGREFWKATWDGWGECIKDLPREINNIVDKISEFFNRRSGKGGSGSFADEKTGELKPSSQVNVYKPNIYFYADEPLEIEVEFMYENLLTETIPEYSYGWDTYVHGNGDITCQDENYDFLFYESLASTSLVVKDTGWIIYADTRSEQLLEVLALYDFNEKETEDFMEFWMEMLDEGVDYVMYPQDTECVDRQMPIEISPTPTQITRIWFGFETYNGQELPTPQVDSIVRDDFTVVEWGGFFLD